jgi:transcription antitermination factor NusG
MDYTVNSLSLDIYQPKWCALFVRVNQEKQVASHLLHREIEHFLPLYLSVRHWTDRRVKAERPLFPGYIFVRIPVAERMKALTVPNVISIVGTNGRPSVIPEEEISWIRRGLKFGGAESHPQVEAGTRVVISSGSLSGLEGIFLEQQNKPNKARILISVNSISRAFVVEVEQDCIELAGRKISEAETGSRRLETAS